jgi:2-dehydro-3-deoxyphosphogluconate aldolase/(4S)-4-hydroxy-2-oxoglutarate aldolase
VARNNDVEVFPGIATATELQRAHNLGLQVVKFFPASIAGGIPAIKALASVFRAMKFMPTGGISAGNLAEYLAVPAVLACGGGWLTPDEAVDAGRFDEVTRLAEEAIAIAAGKSAGRKT